MFGQTEAQRVWGHDAFDARGLGGHHLGGCLAGRARLGFDFPEFDCMIVRQAFGVVLPRVLHPGRHAYAYSYDEQLHDNSLTLTGFAPQISSRRSEEHTSELQSLMRISYAVFCLKKKKNRTSIKQKHKYIYIITLD